MSTHCCPPSVPPPDQPEAYRRVLWIALIVNAGMCVIEVVTGLQANAVSLLADALDFFGDAVNYGLSLWVLGMHVSMRARASLFKACSMALFGIWVLGSAISHLVSKVMPTPETMGTIGLLALVANVSVAWLLYAYRHGDSNMRSVWLCTRNDAIGNLAVILASIGVFSTHSGWPDLIVASLMATLALHAAWQVITQARQELKTH